MRVAPDLAAPAVPERVHEILLKAARGDRVRGEQGAHRVVGRRVGAVAEQLVVARVGKGVAVHRVAARQQLPAPNAPRERVEGRELDHAVGPSREPHQPVDAPVEIIREGVLVAVNADRRVEDTPVSCDSNGVGARALDMRRSSITLVH